MHFAALAYVGELVTAPGRYYDVNTNGTHKLARRNGARRCAFNRIFVKLRDLR